MIYSQDVVAFTLAVLQGVTTWNRIVVVEDALVAPKEGRRLGCNNRKKEERGYDRYELHDYY